MTLDEASTLVPPSGRVMKVRKGAGLRRYTVYSSSMLPEMVGIWDKECDERHYACLGRTDVLADIFWSDKGPCLCKISEHAQWQSLEKWPCGADQPAN